MYYMMLMMRSLQIIMMLPLSRILFPPNVLLVVGLMMPLVMFDVFDNDQGIDSTLILKYDFDGQEKLAEDIFEQ